MDGSRSESNLLVIQRPRYYMRRVILLAAVNRDLQQIPVGAESACASREVLDVLVHRRVS